MRADLVGLGVRLGWMAADEKEEPALAVVRERLRHEGEGILLMYDNALDAEVLKPYLPPGGAARVLVTSNAHAWRGLAEPVEIRLWPKEIGADYLVVRTGRVAERPAAEVLSQALGGLPLAHEQAAAYCERLEVPLAEYLRRFDAAPARMLDTARDAPAEYHDRLTVAKTFALAIDEAARLHPGAEPLIVHAALLAPEPIPLFLFAEGREKFGEPLASALADDGLDEALAALRAFALVDREVIEDERDATITTDCIRLHRLVRQVAAARREGEARNSLLCSLIDAVAAVYPHEVYNEPSTWPWARRLDALALALVDGGEMSKSVEERAASLLDRLGAYRQSALGDYAHSRPLRERALAIREKVLGPEHVDTAVSVNNLANLLQDLGDFEAARPFGERALAIFEKISGPEHPDTAVVLNNLASLLQAQDDLSAARPLYERALMISETAVGPEHPDTAMALNNLANLRHARGDPQAARLLLQRAVTIYEKARGADHPTTNRARRNLAAVLLATGGANEALALGEAALAAHDKALARDHAWIRDSAHVTADALDALGRSAEAAGLRQKYGIVRVDKN